VRIHIQTLMNTTQARIAFHFRGRPTIGGRRPKQGSDSNQYHDQHDQDDQLAKRESSLIHEQTLGVVSVLDAHFDGLWPLYLAPFASRHPIFTHML